MRTIEFKHKWNSNVVIIVTVSKDLRITDVENFKGVRFPFNKGQILNRSIEIWCCINNYFMDGKDTCPTEKIMGIKVTDIPEGHELRLLFPKKFKK